ncbi:hypothetical protein NA57DRAFT_60112 [Rhizodiscina lignyota]|uniref:Uncharacterized protein n=1 Tax=Rhizodiscina lignyota TaxID=1504668 RepID=A0A9P4M4W8_9PEZI|nr:hypothetical protein NA57DRAFT_60112 [Rhizodiscina lignyota]
MTDYQVTIKIDGNWVTDFNNNGMKLVMAKAFADKNGDPSYNIIASTGKVTETMIASWTDSYQMTGSTQTFQNGVTITGLSGAAPISFGETYSLPSWSDHNVAKDPKSPNNGFGFRNEVKASAVVLQNVSNALTPVYITPFELPKGFATLKPLPRVAFWFQADLSTKMMAVIDRTDVYEVDLSGGSSATITYSGENGDWNRPLTNAVSVAVNYLARAPIADVSLPN